MNRGGDQGSCLMRGVARVRPECSLTVLADHLRRVLHLVAMTRLLASFGSGGQGGPMRTTDRRLILATRTFSRPQDRVNPLARPIQPSAMSFDTVWRGVRGRTHHFRFLTIRVSSFMLSS
jgi:hypothetical protein